MGGIMVEVTITDEILEEAKVKAEELGKLRNSITAGEGNLAGFTGEICSTKVIGGELANTYHYDFITSDGKTWDAKTKRRTGRPRSHYNCAVADYNTTQQCDNYIFVSLENLDKAYIVGWLPKEEFYQKAKFRKQGEIDPTSPPGKIFRYTADCYDIQISQLYKVEDLDLYKERLTQMVD